MNIDEFINDAVAIHEKVEATEKAKYEAHQKELEKDLYNDVHEIVYNTNQFIKNLEKDDFIKFMKTGYIEERFGIVNINIRIILEDDTAMCKKQALRDVCKAASDIRKIFNSNEAKHWPSCLKMQDYCNTLIITKDDTVYCFKHFSSSDIICVSKLPH
jgi:hypothetical protein